MRPPRDQWGADAFFEFMLRVDNPRVRRKLWHALCDDPKASLWRLELSNLVTNGRTWSLTQYCEWMSDRFSPHTLIRWLERSVNSGHVTRREANGIEECILERTDRHGNWHSTLYKPDVSGITAAPLATLPVGSLNGALK